MQIQINAANGQGSGALAEHVVREVEHALRVFHDRVTRVEAYLHDLNGPKSGVDQRCVLEARLAGCQPLAVEHDAIDMYDAVRQAAGKLERAVRHKLERLDEHRT